MLVKQVDCSYNQVYEENMLLLRVICKSSMCIPVKYFVSGQIHLGQWSPGHLREKSAIVGWSC